MPVKILVCDDSVTMRKILEMTFAGEDAEVHAVAAVDAAVQAAQHLQPDVVFADASMSPKNGYDLCQALKGAGSSASVIIMASQHGPYDEARGGSVGADANISKPFETQSVIDLVKKLASAPKAARPAAPAAAARPAAPPSAAAAAPAAKPARPVLELAEDDTPGVVTQPKPAAVAPQRPPAAAPARPPAAAPARPPAAAPARPPAAAPQRPPMAAKPSPSLPQRPPASKPATAPAASAPAASKPAAPPAKPVPSGKPAPAPMAAKPAPAAPAAPAAAAASAAVDGMSAKLDGLGLSKEQAEAVLALSREVVEQVVWEVVPDLAEALIKEEIARLTAG